MRRRQSPFAVAVAVAAIHFVVSCSLIVLHLCTTWDPEPAVATGWATGAPLWRAIQFPLGELPLAWMVDRGLILPLLLMFPLNSCVVGGLVAVFDLGIRRWNVRSRAVTGPRSLAAPDAPIPQGDFACLRLPEGARPSRSIR